MQSLLSNTCDLFSRIFDVFNEKNLLTRQKKKKSIPIIMKTCFSEEKLIKQFGNPTLSKTTWSFLSNFFMNPLFVQIIKIRTPPPHNFRGRGNYVHNLRANTELEMHLISSIPIRNISFFKIPIYHQP